jgi:exodeoxyribonuclease VII large subunit
VFREPGHLVRTCQQRVDENVLRLSSAARQRIERTAASVRHLHAKLLALDPSAVLRRGYAVLLKMPDGGVITDAASVALGDTVRARLARGELGLTVRSAAATAAADAGTDAGGGGPESAAGPSRVRRRKGT